MSCLRRVTSIYSLDKVEQDHLIDGLALLWRGLRRIFGKYRVEESRVVASECYDC